MWVATYSYINIPQTPQIPYDTLALSCPTKQSIIKPKFMSETLKTHLPGFFLKIFHEKFQQKKEWHLQVSIPNSVQLIGGWAFYGCSSLLHVTLPVSLTRILARAFAGCSALMSIHIPNSVSFIGAGAPHGLERCFYFFFWKHIFNSTPKFFYFREGSSWKTVDH